MPRPPGPSLAAAFGGMPDLRAGNCQPGNSAISARGWDATDPGEARLAVLACRACPCLSACSTWLSSLPRGRRPSGVVIDPADQSSPPRG